MKIEIDLKIYNRLIAKEEILNQVSDLNTPDNTISSVTAWMNKLLNAINSFSNLYFPEYHDDLIEGVKITLSKKTYDYYLYVQMTYLQIKNTKCHNHNDFNEIVVYHNLVKVYLDTYRRKLKEKNKDIEEFNTLVKMANEKNILKKRNVELEAELDSKLIEKKKIVKEI